MPQPDQVLFGRLLMGTSLGFHIIFAVLGVGLPLMISLAEFVAIRRKDSELMTLAKRWTRGFIVLFAVGATSGTIVGVALSFLWPGFMGVASDAIALPLLIEVWAFFIESIFLGIYIYTWNRFRNPMVHWLCSIPLVMASAASAFLITTANAFMNNPVGFDLVNGKMTNFRPLEAMFGPNTPVQTLHVVVTAWFTVAFITAALASWAILRGRDLSYFRKAMLLSLTVGLAMGVMVVISGDMSAKNIAVNQPAKLAAAEALFVTQPYAPLVVGGLIDVESRQVRYAIELPGFLSFLSWGDFSKPVTGLNDIPVAEWPPLIIHYAFDLMVGSGFFAIAVAGVYLFWPIVQRGPLARLDLRRHKLLLAAVVAAGPLAMLSIEAGWIVTELGRQPWIIYKLMTVAEAVTNAPTVKLAFFGFTGIYLILMATTVIVVNGLTRRFPLDKALAEARAPGFVSQPGQVRQKPGDQRVHRGGGRN